MLDGGHRLAEHPEGQGQIHVRIQESALLHAKDLLNDLYTNSTNNHRSCGCKCWNNFACNEFDLEVRHLGDIVVPGTQVGNATDAFNVEVSRVILLEFNCLYG